MAMAEDELKKLIVESGLIEAGKLETLAMEAKEKGVSLAAIIVEKDLITDKNLGLLMADFLKVPFVKLSETSIPWEVLNIVPEVVARKQKIIVFGRDQAGLSLAMMDPENKEIVEFIGKKTGDKVKVYLATEKDISLAWGLYKKNLKESFDQLLTKKLEEVNKNGVAEAPIAEIVDLLISYAFANRASDVHIEPEKDISIVRFRVDGILHDVLKFPIHIHEQVISRIKIAAKLKTDEHLSAQDGKMQVSLPEEELDIRVSIVPITKGEKTVLRLLSSKTRQLTLGDLGMNERDLAKFKEAFSKPFGMILSTGPTGSGKTTTIYAILKILNTRDVNIASIEDPVEYDIQGINQIQVNTATNLTFANGLRSILRQDPNVIYVGEIRDSETAGIAINSAMTGHLVLSTLHTNDAATALPRLIDMEIEPYLVASTVNLIVGQRLVRKICEKCRFSTSMQAETIAKHVSTKIVKKVFGKGKQIRVYQGKGCPVCHSTGFAGRIGVFEVLPVTEEIKKLIVAKADSGAISAKAEAMGMKTMMEDGLEKVLAGLTTVEEVLRVTKEQNEKYFSF